MAGQNFTPSLYSNSKDLTEDARAVVLAVEGKGDAFRTSFVDTGGGGRRWLEAHRNQLTGQWDVYRYQDLTKDIHNQDPLALRAVSFFDALYFCASTEMVDRAGNAEFIEDNSSGVPHFTAAADAADVPLDDESLPLPADNGVILVQATYGDKAKEVAKRTVSKKLVLADRGKNRADHINALLLYNGDQGASLVDKKLAAHSQKLAFIDAATPLHISFDAARELCHVLRSDGGQVEEAKMDKVGTIATGGVTALALAVPVAALSPLLLPFIPLAGAVGAGYLYDKWQRSNTHQFEVQNKQLQAVIDKMPEGPAKAILADFKRAARGGYYLEAAARKLEELRAQDTGKVRQLKALEAEGLALVTTAVKEGGWLDTDRERLEAAFRSGNFPRPGEFRVKIDDHYIKLHKVLQDAQDEMKQKLLPLPPPETKALPPGPTSL